MPEQLTPETKTVEAPVARNPNPKKTSWLPLVMVLLISSLSAAMFFQIQSQVIEIGPRDSNKYILPPGFSGKIRILYNVPDAEPLEIEEDGTRVIRIPLSGIVETSTPFQYGTATDSMYRRTTDGELEQLSVAHLKERKIGIIGDKNEFFESPTEAEEWRGWMRDQGWVDEEGEILLGGTASDDPADMIHYEHIAVHNEF